MMIFKNGKDLEFEEPDHWVRIIKNNLKKSSRTVINRAIIKGKDYSNKVICSARDNMSSQAALGLVKEEIYNYDTIRTQEALDEKAESIINNLSAVNWDGSVLVDGVFPWLCGQIVTIEDSDIGLESTDFLVVECTVKDFMTEIVLNNRFTSLDLAMKRLDLRLGATEEFAPPDKLDNDLLLVTKADVASFPNDGWIQLFNDDDLISECLYQRDTFGSIYYYLANFPAPSWERTTDSTPVNRIKVTNASKSPFADIDLEGNRFFKWRRTKVTIIVALY
jgi:hypothetical protein